MEPNYKKTKLNHEPNTAVKLALAGYFALMLGFAVYKGSTWVCKVVYSDSPKLTQCQDTFSTVGRVSSWAGIFALAI